MKVSSINNNYCSGKLKQNNRQPNFMSLKGIEYNWKFNPKESLEYAEVLLAFKKSKPITRFFEKYDGFAKFYARDGSSDLLGSKGDARLEIYYNPKSINKTGNQEEKVVKNKNFLKNILEKFKNWFLEDEIIDEKEKSLDEKYLKSQYEYFEISSKETFLGKNCARTLKEKITGVTDADISKELEKNATRTLEKQREAAQLKRIHEELKGLL